MRRRQGFTLAEVLVILAILAILVGVLVPTITNQVRKGDVNAVSSDLANLRTGMEAFLTDVHRYPRRLSHLAVSPSATANDINGAVYPAGLRARWAGPYLDKELVNNGTLPTGFGSTIADSMVIQTNANGIPHVAVQVNGLAVADFNSIDELLDGTPANATAGRFRCTVSGTACGPAYFLALPIN